jgi:drug/metabolite transporter (DMT)-like permease
LKIFVLKDKIDPKTYSILESCITLVFTAILVIIFGFQFTGGVGEIAFLIVKAMISGGAALLLTTSLKHIVASEYQIIGSSTIFVTMAAGTIFFGEALTPVNLISSGLVIAAILLMLFRKAILISRNIIFTHFQPIYCSE